jgi:glycosyltransferase involved in cell wall biosynthesis
VQGVKEQIVPGKTGFVFESENPASLQSELENLIDHPDVIRQVGDAGRKFALKHFTLDVMAKNTVKVYQKIIDQH